MCCDLYSRVTQNVSLLNIPLNLQDFYATIRLSFLFIYNIKSKNFKIISITSEVYLLSCTVENHFFIQDNFFTLMQNY